MGRGKSGDASIFWMVYSKLTDKDLPVLVATGIPASTLSSYKGANRYPRADEAARIARALGVTVEYLVTGADSTDPWLREHRQLVDDLKMLTPESLADQEAAIHAIAERRRRELGGGSATG